MIIQQLLYGCMCLYVSTKRQSFMNVEGESGRKIVFFCFVSNFLTGIVYTDTTAPLCGAYFASFSFVWLGPGTIMGITGMDGKAVQVGNGHGMGMAQEKGKQRLAFPRLSGRKLRV